MLTWFMLGGGILLLIPHHVTARFQFAVLDVLRLPIRSGRMIGLWTQATASTGRVVSQQEYDVLVQENRQLLNRASNLEAAVVQQQQQIEQLSGFRQNRAWDQMGLLVSDTFTRVDPYHLDVNLGSADGLVRGLIVIAENAVVGTITDVGAHSARVEWVASRTSRKLPVTVGASKAQGVLVGLGNGLMKIQVKRPCTVAKGDTVYVQKIPGLLEQRVVVGVVVECTDDDQEPVLQQIKVQPVCDLSRVTSVSVVKVKTPQASR